MSDGYLLDVNVLIAAIWPMHESHSTVQRWLGCRVRDGWATCPLTEAAFVRMVSNPAFSPNVLTPGNALALLAANLGHAAHHFWEDEIGFLAAVEPFAERLVGRQQVPMPTF